MIHTINLNNLRNAEYLQFGKDAGALLSDADATALGINKPNTNFKSSIADIETAFKTEQSSPLSAKLAELDFLRDNAFLGIWYIADGYLLHFDEAVIAQAQIVKKNLVTYGRDTIKISYPAETASINSMVNDWGNKPDLTAAIAALHLTDWKVGLKQINTDFETTYTERTKNEGDAAAINPVKTLRLPSVKLWDKLATTINAQYILHDEDAVMEPKYLSLINNINALVDTYKNILTLRQAKNKKASTTATISTPPTTNG